MAENKNTGVQVSDGVPDVIVMKFADSRIPVFKESKNKDYIKYGEHNNYPEYLTYLFNKSAKHNAILSGKANYVFGKGFNNGDFKINRLGESLNDISKKAILDIEIYGGFRLEIIWSLAGKISEIYHVDYSTLRLGKSGCYYYKEFWNVKDAYDNYRDNNSEPEQEIASFNPAIPVGNQIFAYNEYRPMTRFYPLPAYLGCNNYIEVDIEISKYYLSAIRNGMMPSKLVQFYQGDPGEDKKREIEKRFGQKFAGSENAGKFVLVFNPGGKDKSIEISDLSASEVDKQFVELNKTTQQEIFSGHLVTSPMLFGIMEPGKLGGSTELYTAYAIFQNTYSKPKAGNFSKEIQYLLSYSLFASEYDLLATDPIGVQFDVKDVINALPKEFVFTSLGIPKEMWGLENIGSDNKPTPTIPIAPSTTTALPTDQPAVMSNDNIKNLSAKQHQQLMRVIRQYGKGQLTELAAKALLRTGLGLSEADINSLLGIQAAEMSFDAQEENIIAMFDACGESKNDFEVLRSKRVSFSSELEAEFDEEIFIKEAFKTATDLTDTEAKIVELIKKDPLIDAETLSQAINETVSFIKQKIENLIKRGVLESSMVDGIENLIVADIKLPPVMPSKVNPAKIFIKYSYEGPQDSRNRPFCAKLMELHRLYSRADIENISARLGYSVFDRRGGFWRHKDGSTTAYCRHNWRSNLIVQK